MVKLRVNNFLEFIKSDIESKKTFLLSIPTNNKTNVKKFNENVASIYESYSNYKESVLKYINAKSEAFENVKETKPDEKLVEQLEDYKKLASFFNPINTFKEKLGLDSLLYDIHNYSYFTFENINKTIQSLIDKFKVAGIGLTSNDFKYTCYVKEYMDEFFACNGDFNKLSPVFEKIYWHNPNLIEHIELNFRKLIKKYRKEFEQYAAKEKEELLKKNNFKDYEELAKSYKTKYEEYVSGKEESLFEIVKMAKESKIEINNYFPDSKFRTTAFATLTINPINYENNDEFNKLLDTLKKLKSNVLEYNGYLKFLQLFKNFKEKYEKLDSLETNASALKTIESQISTKESKLDSLNNKIFDGPTSAIFGLFDKKNPEHIKKLKLESIALAKELYDLYYEEEKLRFESIVLEMKNESAIMASDVIKLYYSFDCYKRETLASVFELTTYDDIINLCNEFDEFASNPTNIIIQGIDVFEGSDMADVVCNKYRLENINISAADLDENNIVSLINKIDFVFRIYQIEHSKLSIEKIWFIVQNAKIQDKENVIL